MERRKVPLLIAMIIGLAIPCAVLCSAGGQNPPKDPAHRSSDVPYHLTDGIAESHEAPASIGTRKPAPVQALSKSSLASLTKISIIPSSFAFTGPHYSQRLVIEGVFADGHQEELTANAAVTISYAVFCLKKK